MSPSRAPSSTRRWSLVLTLLACTSKDGLGWVRLQDPLLFSDKADWTRSSFSELIGYTSLVDGAGASSLGKDAWLYYMYLEPDAGFADRSLVRREVKVDVKPAPLSPNVRVALTRYFDAARSDHFVSLDPACEGAHTDFTLGYIEQSAP